VKPPLSVAFNDDVAPLSMSSEVDFEPFKDTSTTAPPVPLYNMFQRRSTNVLPTTLTDSEMQGIKT
jgi:hypothetical protein